MTEALLLISAICLIVSGQIPEYDKEINNGYCDVYSSPGYNIIMRIAKYSSLVPVFMLIYELGHGKIAWFFKMVIWVIFYLIFKVFGTWLFDVVFGFGRGGAMTSIIVLIVGIVTFIIALTI